MTFTKLSLPTALLTSALMLSACGGAGLGGGGGDYEPRGPVKGLSMQEIEATTGARNRQEKEMLTAGIGMSSSNYVARFMKGNVTFSQSRLLDDDETEDAAVTIKLDIDGNGVIEVGQDEPDLSYSYNFNPGDNPIMDATGGRLVRWAEGTAGGEKVLVSAHIPSYDGMTVLYLPADSAQKMYGGMIHHTDAWMSGAGGATGVFGIETTSDQMSAQIGTVRYNGTSIATVSRQRGTSGGDAGLYSGEANAEVDFTGRTMTAQTVLERERTVLLEGESPSTDSIIVDASGTFTTGGNITGTTVFTGLDNEGVISGDFSGKFYGPNAETLGGVFNGHNDDAGIAGGLLVNRTDD